MRVSQDEQRRGWKRRRSTEDPQHGASVGHRSEPRAEEPADLRGAADAADAPDDSGETKSSPATLPSNAATLDLWLKGGRDRSVTRELESSDGGHREKLVESLLQAISVPTFRRCMSSAVQVFLGQQDKLRWACINARFPPNPQTA